MMKTLTMKRKPNKQKFKEIPVEDDVIEERVDMLGYCSYCKNPVGHNDKFRRFEDEIKHEDCIQEENGIVKELKFD